MRRQAISYAIIRFRPHAETEEFANIGIVLLAPQMGYLDFRLETKRFGRLTSFFDSVEATTIRSVLKNYYAELKRIRDIAGHNGSGQARFEFEITDNAEHLFYALTKDREGIIRFSEVRFAMTEDPRNKLDELFAHYVRRNFASSTYREGLLERHVRTMLKLREIDRNFKRLSFNDGVYSATFPFVELADDKPVKILKPIYLGQEDPSRILDHGNKWLFTVNRLKKLLPRDIVFAVEGPAGQSLRRQAFQEAIEQFRASDIQVVDATKERELLEAVHG
ncbi:DUF3037 domain-containing protein [Rhizobium sp. RMa-01]|uniref:DUF3037 domain-containing protein n=1 Tax=unclassified Rhizobium TaxID=2613769 RepID=UPI0008DA20B6|nr:MULTISPECIES: DUF3037 domain-containing protein [unclassified Rhizobium]OHV23795.1 hypothetical protein BBJ66_26850 [Rhizobium sp. RSm-3]RVU06746.1 DUF3037 domain-containing protein [Rhizobium sp. RMa-01]